MAFTNETKNYGLPEWIGPDKPTWLVDLNNAFETIDNQMKSNETAAMQAKQIGESALDTAGNAVEATHTNAAAITALTASLAETDTRVDVLEIPANSRLTTRGTITSFGNEEIRITYLNSNVRSRILYVGAGDVKKNAITNADPSKQLPSYMTKVFSGSIPLFGNEFDPPIGTDLGNFVMLDHITGVAIFGIIGRGTDAYYYGMSDEGYSLMSDNGYSAFATITNIFNSTFWPTT